MGKRRNADMDYFEFAMYDDGTSPNSLARSPYPWPRRSVRDPIPRQLPLSETPSNADQSAPRRPTRAKQTPARSEQRRTSDQLAVQTTQSNSKFATSSHKAETRRSSSAIPKQLTSQALRRSGYTGPMAYRMGSSRMTTKMTTGERLKLTQRLSGKHNQACQQIKSDQERMMKFEREQMRERRKAEQQEQRAKSIMASRRCDNYNVIDLTQTDNEDEPKVPCKEDKLEMVSDDDDDDDIMQVIQENNYRSQKDKGPGSEMIATETAQSAPIALSSAVPPAIKEKENVILLSSDDEGTTRLKRRRPTRQRGTNLCGLSVSDSSFAPPGSDIQQDEPMPPRRKKSTAKRRRSPLKEKDPLKPIEDQIETDLCSIENYSKKMHAAKEDNVLREKNPLNLRISTVPAFPKEIGKHGDSVIVVSDEESSVQIVKDTPHKPGIKRVTENRTIPTSSFYGKAEQTDGGTIGKLHIPGLKSKVRDDPQPQEVIPLEPSDDEDDDVIECEPVTRQTRGLELSDYEMPACYIKQEPTFEPDSKRARDIRFRPLNIEELTLIRSLTHEVPKQRVLVRIQEANIQLKGEDFACLRGSRWLNDEILNSFVALINSRNIRDVQSEAKLENDGLDLGKLYSIDVDARASDIFSQKRPKTHMFNTFFFPRLTQKGYDYNGVRRWLKRAGLSVLSLDLILIPINLKNFHWVLTAIDLRSKQFLYLDSTYGKDTSNTIPMLKQWLFDEVKDKHGAEAAEKMGISCWGVHINPSYLPRQQDGGSCGVFTLYMADYLERGLCPNFTQKDIRNLRWRTVLFLNEGYVPT